ncbi:MAG: helix-turn-helix transcriptional regulator [Spirochaetales bacterium]|nr:helix-turn-helix transcriptional regulator [Spirochaetales bacterium]
MIKLLSIGSSMSYPERKASDIYKNDGGFGHWVFMHFTTAFRVMTPQGLMERKAGDFLINSPEYPQWHQGINCCFKNDWFHFDGDSIDKYLKKYQIPVNIPFTCFQESRVLGIVHEIQREHILQDPYENEKIDLHVKTLLIELARGMKNQRERSLSVREKELLPRFQEIRLEMGRSPEKDWPISLIADRLSLSANRFAVLYKRFFAVTPRQDLLSIRLNKASALLLNQTGKVETIARECGFSSEQYFWRMFKKKYNISPSEFRKSSPYQHGKT